MRALILLSAGILVGCGGVTPKADSPAGAKERTVQAHAAKPGEPPRTNAKRAKGQTGELDGVMFVRQTQFDQRVPVQPAEMDLDSLPSYAVPEPLAYNKAPAALPASLFKAPLRNEKIDPGYGYGGYGTAVYVILEAKLGRLQIGSVAENSNAADRVYRTCGESYYTQPALTPARWETLTMGSDGKPEYRIVDAWFDAKSCEASVVSETVVHPKPVLGGLMYGFQSTCESCPTKHSVTFLSPALSQLAASGLGGTASVSHGSFSIIRLPVRKGGAASFTGMIHSHSLSQWLSPMPKAPEIPSVAEPVQFKGAPVPPPQPSFSDAHFGIEITQTVNDEAPTAIAYATFMQR
jgi:hypothetical protein